MAHTLGVHIYYYDDDTFVGDKKLPKEFTRNNYCAGDESHVSYEELVKLVELKIMEKYICRDSIYFNVTEFGKKEFREQFYKLIKK